jgi:hypothetical protein
MKHWLKSWKTSLSGVAVLITTAAHIASNPVSLTDPTTLGGLISGVGLLMAKDFDASHTKP